MPLLECVRLFKAFGDKLALDCVDFRIEQGEIVALVGLEGAGKTTAYGLVCGLLSPTSGRVLFNGVDVALDAGPAGASRNTVHFTGRKRLPEDDG